MIGQWSQALTRSAQGWNVAELLEALGMTSADLSAEEWVSLARVTDQDQVTVARLAGLIRRSR